MGIILPRKWDNTDVNNKFYPEAFISSMGKHGDA